MSEQLMPTAYHEAGHAVMMLGLGLKLESVSIAPTADALGHVELHRSSPAHAAPGRAPALEPSTAQLVVIYATLVVCKVAGGESERLAGYEPAGGARDEPGSDEHGEGLLAERVWELTGVEPRQWRQVARSEAARYLRENWRAVGRVVHALLAAYTLSGDEARQAAGDLPEPDLRGLVGALHFWWRRSAARAACVSELRAGRSRV